MNKNTPASGILAGMIWVSGWNPCIGAQSKVDVVDPALITQMPLGPGAGVNNIADAAVIQQTIQLPTALTIGDVVGPVDKIETAAIVPVVKVESRQFAIEPADVLKAAIPGTKRRKSPLDHLRYLGLRFKKLSGKLGSISSNDARSGADFIPTTRDDGADPFLVAEETTQTPNDKTRALTLADLSRGPPAPRGTILPRSQYVRVRARKLTQARVLWVNYNYLREQGIQVPPGGMTPEFEQKLLDAFAYGIPAEGEPAEAFSDARKVFFADRYGGSGLGENLGSGRAASAGKIQIKGIGRTPLVRENGADGSNGFIGLEGAMREAFWGEVNQALPYGANRVIAVIDRGTGIMTPDGKPQRNALVVRENPIRPAHFMKLKSGGHIWNRRPVFSQHPGLPYAELLAEALPVPENMRRANLSGRIVVGLLTYVDRIASQHATAFAMRLYHGAPTESNVELSGRFLDYGTQTALPGYGKLYVLDFAARSGDTRDFKQNLIKNVISDMRRGLGSKLARSLPSLNTFLARFDETYGNVLRRGFLRLTGVPSAIADRLDHAPEARSLGDIIGAVAVSGAKEVLGKKYEVLGKYSVPGKITRYDLGALLTGLAAEKYTDEAAVESWLRSRISEKSDPSLARDLAKAYAEYLRLVLAQASEEGIEPDALWRRIQDNAAARNGRMSSAYSWNMKDANLQVIEKYRKKQDPALIQRAIDSRIAAVRKYLAK